MHITIAGKIINLNYVPVITLLHGDYGVAFGTISARRSMVFIFESPEEYQRFVELDPTKPGKVVFKGREVRETSALFKRLFYD